MSKKKEQSVEPAVVRNYTAVLERLNVHFYEQQISMGNSIDEALKNAESKRGGTGDNRPDIKLLLEDTHARRVPVMIEAKGLYGKLEKRTKTTNEIELVTIYEKDGQISKKTGKPTHYAGDSNYTAITDYAVNGAIHYANAILDAKDYTEVIAIGINGHGEENGNAKNLECKAYYISEKNNRVPKLISNITEKDWSLLKNENISKLYKNLDTLNLTQEEYEKIVSKAESDLDAKILKIHQKIYDDKAITLKTEDKMYLFCGLIMAGLSADGLEELKVSSLKSSTAEKQSDGAKIMTQIEAYLDCKKCPKDKEKLILQTLAPVFDHEDLWKPIKGESILKALFKQVKTDIVPCLESPLHLDFMGRIFNRLGDWIPIAADKKNDVVLTPRYVARLMAKLCRVNKNSFVWDRTMGSAGFLVTAMDLMVKDAQQTINDEKELADKIENIKKHQLFGIESLPEIFILAVLNMILMGDGSSNMVRGDGHNKTIGDDFPANVFLLNPPYSADGKGFVFVEEALSMMDEGYAAVLIQENAGAGNGLPYTKRILENHTLLASIHMSDIFCGKASVQTAIYLFEIGEKHNPKKLVKFIDFSNDGYARQSRKKSSQDVNLKNVDDAIGRYLELERIILGQQSDTSYYTKDNGLYIEDVISLEGDDWTFSQHKKVDLEPTENDFKDTVRDFLCWKISAILKGELEASIRINEFDNYKLNTHEIKAIEDFDSRNISYGLFKVGELFDIRPTKSHNCTNPTLYAGNGTNPVVTNSSVNNGRSGFSLLPTTENDIITFSDTTSGMNTLFYQEGCFVGYSHVQKMHPYSTKWTKDSCLFFIAVLKKHDNGFNYATKMTNDIVASFDIMLPILNESVGKDTYDENDIDFHYMENYIRALKKQLIENLLK